MIVIITYKSGHRIALHKSDPNLLETLIHDHDLIEEIEEAEFISPEEAQPE